LSEFLSEFLGRSDERRKEASLQDLHFQEHALRVVLHHSARATKPGRGQFTENPNLHKMDFAPIVRPSLEQELADLEIPTRVYFIRPPGCDKTM